jgi:hypothetical protein
MAFLHTHEESFLSKRQKRTSYSQPLARPCLPTREAQAGISEPPSRTDLTASVVTGHIPLPVPGARCEVTRSSGSSSQLWVSREARHIPRLRQLADLAAYLPWGPPEAMSAPSALVGNAYNNPLMMEPTTAPVTAARSATQKTTNPMSGLLTSSLVRETISRTGLSSKSLRR